jgi:hypothetical protein
MADAPLCKFCNKRHWQRICPEFATEPKAERVKRAVPELKPAADVVPAPKPNKPAAKSNIRAAKSNAAKSKRGGVRFGAGRPRVGDRAMTSTERSTRSRARRASQ